MVRQAQELGLGGRGWTERSEGSPGVSGDRPPTPATPKIELDAPLFHSKPKSPQGIILDHAEYNSQFTVNALVAFKLHFRVA